MGVSARRRQQGRRGGRSRSRPGARQRPPDRFARDPSCVASAIRSSCPHCSHPRRFHGAASSRPGPRSATGRLRPRHLLVEFSFYMDGRFHRQYQQDCGDGTSATGEPLEARSRAVQPAPPHRRNPRFPTTRRAGEHLELRPGRRNGPADGRWHDTGPARTRARRTVRDHPLPERAVKPLRGVGELEETITCSGNVLDFGEHADHWTPLVADKLGRLRARPAVRRGRRGRSDRPAACWPDPDASTDQRDLGRLMLQAAVERAVRAAAHHPGELSATSVRSPSSTTTDGTVRGGDLRGLQGGGPHLIAITGCEQSPGRSSRC